MSTVDLPQLENSKIKVAVRIRPLLEHELMGGHEASKFMVDGNAIVVNNAEDKNKQYKFDRVFDQETSQTDVYSKLGINQLVKKVVEGYHATVFAYGQTGSGKTFTMEGYDYVSKQPEEGETRITQAPVINPDSDNVGVTQRAINDLFKEIRRVKEQEGKHISIFVSFLQIYNEKVFDLLNIHSLQQNSKKNHSTQANHQGLRIRWTKKEQFVVENLYVFECITSQEVMQLFNSGIKNKIVASHNLNNASSRSHAIFTVTIETVDPSNLDNVVTSKLQLVDLAGSEKISATGNTGISAKESIDINKSLFVLRKVINRLSELSSQGRECNETYHVPYRDSKLTSLLKQSLGGNSYCLMIACISPSDRFYEESISTLNYASRAANISNQPIKNIDPKIKIINELKHKVRLLQIELKNANEHIAYLTQMTGEKVKIFGIQLMKVEDDYIDLGDEQAQKKAVQEDKSSTNLSKRGSNGIPPKSDQADIKITTTAQGKKTTRTITLDGTEEVKSSNLQVYPQTTVQKRQGSVSPGEYRAQVEQENERLVESVSKVTDLLKCNQILRDDMDKITRQTEEKDNEIYTISKENIGLRERIEILENIIKSNQSEYENLVSAKVINNMEKSTYEFHGGTKGKNSSIDQVYLELIDLRENNRILEKRVKTLEKQNIEISKNLNFVGNYEPARPIFKQRRNKPESGYQQDSDQFFHEEPPEQRPRDNQSVNKNMSLSKVQSTPLMKKNQTQLNQQIPQYINPPDSQGEWADSQSMMKMTQYSKGSVGSLGTANQSSNRWFTMKKKPAPIPQTNNEMIQNIVEMQNRLLQARQGSDIAAVVPPMGGNMKKQRSDVSPQPTLAQMMRKRK